LTAPPVKAVAQSLGLPVVQPTKMKDGTLAATLAAYELDVIVVVAFGRILPPAILELPRHGCINVHGSLLPRWRGAAPIQRAVLAGDAHTGVAIMKMDVGLDTGPVYEIVRTEIGETETSGDLFVRLASLGAEALGEFLSRFPDVPSPTVQSDDGMTHAAMLEKSEGRVAWARPAAVVGSQIRGMDPWPAAFTAHGEGGLKLYGARVEDVALQGAEPGTIIGVSADGLAVACSEGAVLIAEVQPAGKRRMPAAAWAAGRQIKPGARLLG
ncbi:MAG: methionyl-tRNA formyltransferase, partial [Nannocystaceae bacterium]|nr:methionyl-tRNA formyltransferase [Nannocystaceae bacterium]